MPPSTRTSLAVDAIRHALRTLGTLPESEEARDLRERCLADERVAERWALQPPTAEERDAFMKRVLGLQVSVTRLVQRSRSASESDHNGDADALVASAELRAPSPTDARPMTRWKGVKGPR